MPVINSIADHKDEAAGWRQELHQNPQTSFEEEFASTFVKKKLTEWGIPFKDGIAVTGIVATIEGQKTDSGKAIGLRADMDALDIIEDSGVPYASKNPGKMHACGHDGHTSTLLSAAKYLSENRNFNGKVHLIFQPAEEGGGGAYKMIEEGLFKDFPCDYVFGYHNWPYMPLGKVAMRKGPILASADEFEIVIKGKGGHAAMPHQTVDPVVAAAQIVLALQSIVSRNVSPVDQGVVTVANFRGGTGAHNIIGEKVVMNGTVRAFRQETREFILKRVREIAENTAKAFMTEATVHIVPGGYAPTINSEDGVDMAAAAAIKVAGEQNVMTDAEPTMGAEDFGAYLMEKPGAFILIGQGMPDDEKSPHNYGLHSPYYDFNDEVLPIGASYFATLVEDYMPLDK
ncbi:MAG: amidohydrolase [Rhodospirillales bacterium]|nr:amidohydrolase [Rhodospirillales bacterium]MCB9996378.1 amidohydrolase [Rhodospirillales bacterium]